MVVEAYSLIDGRPSQILDKDSKPFVFNVSVEDSLGDIALFPVSRMDTRDLDSAFVRRLMVADRGEDPTLRFVPQNVYSQNKAPHETIFVAFKDGEIVQHRGFEVFVTVHGHGKRSFAINHGRPPVTDEFSFPKDAVLVALRRTEEANIWLLPLKDRRRGKVSGVMSTIGWFNTREEARQALPEERKLQDERNTLLGPKFGIFKIGQPILQNTRALNEQF